MDRKTWLSGVVTAIAVSSGTLVLTAGPASAATCQAQPFSSCVAVSYQTSQVKSIRVNGRCLIGPSGQHPNVVIGHDETPFVQTYGGARCEGNTENRARVNIGGEDANRYRWIWIS
ncbi:hypothetical protein [Lentzea sp. NPDC004782]|uniref:hypothetical protein n=1 Tax=Lentzea sp. NPDC004782 TaxID=3154458 RepID=UPI0033A6F5D2